MQFIKQRAKQLSIFIQSFKLKQTAKIHNNHDVIQNNIHMYKTILPIQICTDFRFFSRQSSRPLVLRSLKSSASLEFSSHSLRQFRLSVVEFFTPARRSRSRVLNQRDFRFGTEYSGDYRVVRLQIMPCSL